MGVAMKRRAAGRLAAAVATRQHVTRPIIARARALAERRRRRDERKRQLARLAARVTQSAPTGRRTIKTR